MKPDLANEAVARATRDRDLAVNLQFAAEVARGVKPEQAIRTVAFKSGIQQSKVREIIATKPPAVRRLTNQEARAT